MSKALQAINLYNELTQNGTVEVARKDMLKAFQDQLGLSAQGASTYHGNIKRGLPGWTLETRKVKAEKVEVVAEPTTELVSELTTELESTSEAA